MSVLLALVAVLASISTGAVAVWTYKAHGRIVERAQSQEHRINAVEKVLNGSLKERN